MGRGTWRNSELILLYRKEGGGGGLQFPGLVVPQRNDMKHVKIKKERKERERRHEKKKQRGGVKKSCLRKLGKESEQERSGTFQN